MFISSNTPEMICIWSTQHVTLIIALLYNKLQLWKINYQFLSFEVFAVVIVKITVFWVLALVVFWADIDVSRKMQAPSSELKHEGSEIGLIV